ncbi:MAG: BrnT family toxin [Alphaproteobacteria bacterium]|nr:BrnT family toxin [Alphaproteobacteria bacterium]
MVRISYDAAKRQANLAKHGIDLDLAAAVFASVTYDFPDTRRDYGERRMISIGHLAGRMVMVVWTERSGERRIISLRKCNDREQARYGRKF